MFTHKHTYSCYLTLKKGENASSSRNIFTNLQKKNYSYKITAN